jgi:hypothetical protein
MDFKRGCLAWFGHIVPVMYYPTVISACPLRISEQGGDAQRWLLPSASQNVSFQRNIVHILLFGLYLAA